MLDEPRPVATDRDMLTIEETADVYAVSGHPRTVRTIQRYCATGHLECVKAPTSLGDKYFVHRDSIARHLAQIEELAALDTRPSQRDTSRPIVTPIPAPIVGDQARRTKTPEPVSPTVAAEPPAPLESNPSRPAATEAADMSRQDAADAPHVARERERLEQENERLRDDITFLRQQVHTKDNQIEALLERDRETNFLVQGLQQMLSPLLGAPKAQDHREPLSADRIDG